jgi:hypothetical protein
LTVFLLACTLVLGLAVGVLRIASSPARAVIPELDWSALGLLVPPEKNPQAAGSIQAISLAIAASANSGVMARSRFQVLPIEAQRVVGDGGDLRWGPAAMPVSQPQERIEKREILVYPAGWNQPVGSRSLALRPRFDS